MFHHSRRAWASYAARDGRALEHALLSGQPACCPCCGEAVELQSRTRLQAALPPGARGRDVECRGCRRFWCLVQHSSRSLSLLRMRRFVAAVRAVEPEPVAVPVAQA
jgi:hypothetical protein